MHLFGRLKKVKFAVPEDSKAEQENLVSKDMDSFDVKFRELGRKHRTQKRWIIGLTTFSILAVAFIVFLIINPERRRRVNTPIPDFPMVPMTFEQDNRFTSLTSPESDAAWSSTMPSGDGFIVVDDARKFGLPPGKDNQKGEVYDTSLFHQLHCLASIRIFMSVIRQAMGRNDTFQIEKVVLDPREDHMAHCFDYLRQSLMCHGDMTLEWPRTEPDGSRVAVDGWGVEHQCKSWTSIIDYMERHAG